MSNGRDISNNLTLTDDEKKAYVARMKAAWMALPDEQKKALQPLLDTAHQQFADFVQNKKPPDHRYHTILEMKSYLEDDKDGHLQNLHSQVATGIVFGLGPEGQVYGIGKYEELDPGWVLMTGTIWLENLLHRHPFPPGTPTVKSMPDEGTIRITMAGDFGTGNFGTGESPSTKISKIMASFQPQLTIHLGDVYYAGTGDEETGNLLKYWPPGSVGSFTLNSNHEMYPGGVPYFSKALNDPLFKDSQAPYSFFALENSSWIVVGLDSAYDAGVLDLYMNGSLGNNAQLPFLQSLAQKNKRMIVLTHHNGFDLGGYDPKNQLKLFQEVTGALKKVTQPIYWYWGHKHAAAVYKPLKDFDGMNCRCAGHGALPWGMSSELQEANKPGGQVEWFENTKVGDPDDPDRVFNGCVRLDINGENLTETFYDEKGRIAWSNGKVYYRG